MFNFDKILENLQANCHSARETMLRRAPAYRCKINYLEHTINVYQRNLARVARSQLRRSNSVQRARVLRDSRKFYEERINSITSQQLQLIQKLEVLTSISADLTQIMT